ncbi:MAG: hypothetical protein Q9174_003726 [Haloplaca sp. 1 TL-2023]
MTRVMIAIRVTAVMKLHRFHIFTNLQRLIIGPRDLYFPDDMFDFEEGDFAVSAPERLLQILGGFGLRVNDLHVDVMLHLYDRSISKDENIANFLSGTTEQRTRFLIEEFYKPLQPLSELTEMATTAQSIVPEFVDTLEKVATLVDNLASLPTSTPSLYLDLEGVNLSRHGSVSILQIYAQPVNRVYLVDVHTLQDQAFSTPGKDNSATLKSILESATIPKVFFDVRNDSDALFGHFTIRLSRVEDLQLMEFATRNFFSKNLNGLDRCVERDANLTMGKRNAFKSIKAAGMDLFLPKRGGSYEVFNHRPLRPELKAYCAQDVEIMPGLYDVYYGKMKIADRNKVAYFSAARVAQSQSPTFNGKGPHMALGPW